MTNRGLIAALALFVPQLLTAQNVAEVQVAPPSVTIRVGERTGLLATAFDRIGNVIPTVRLIVPAQNNRTVNPLVLQWASSDQSVARVSLAGVVTAAGPGKASLSVSGLLQNKSIEVSVHQVVDKLSVRPPRVPDVSVPLTGTARFEAQALTSDNTPVPEAPLRWSVADPA